jgi:CBS domain containing-hemolysin-like protein
VLDFLLKTYSTNKNIRNLIEDLDEGGAVEMKQQALKKGILDFIASTVEKIMIVKNDLEVQNKEARKRLQDIKKNEERSIANYQRILKEKDDKLRSDLQLLDAL